MTDNNFITCDRMFYIPDKTLSKVVEHLDVMNSWTFPEDDNLKSYEGKFTIADSFMDLVGKGFIRYCE